MGRAYSSSRYQYDAPLPLLVRMVDLLVGLQVEWVSRTVELLSIGVADRRSDALGAKVADAVSRCVADLDLSVAHRLELLVASLPQRFADIASCGVPESLVHGDFHPGNVIGSEERLVLRDWGDSAVGHPMLDQAAFVQRLDEADREVSSTARPRGGAKRSRDASRSGQLRCSSRSARCSMPRPICCFSTTSSRASGSITAPTPATVAARRR